MDNFLQGDTQLIKELTDEINRLRQENSKLLDELNVTKLTLASKEQERLDAFKQSENQTAIEELEITKDYVKRVVPNTFLIQKFIDKQIKSLKRRNK
jgi:hypothetical protein